MLADAVAATLVPLLAGGEGAVNDADKAFNVLEASGELGWGRSFGSSTDVADGLGEGMTIESSGLGVCVGL